METRRKFRVLGRTIGTITKLTYDDDVLVYISNFIPFDHVNLLPGDVCINFETGELSCYNENDEEIQTIDDLITVLKDIPLD